MSKIRNYLKGKKSYLTALAIIIIGIITDSPEMIAIGVGMIPMRVAIGK